jgi:hypothetical protein
MVNWQSVREVLRQFELREVRAQRMQLFWSFHAIA